MQMDWISEWRSITPERLLNQVATKPNVTEPAENKQTAKSLSQENSNKSTATRSYGLNFGSQLLQKPLTQMKTSMKKLSEIGQQINSIIQSHHRIQRPQSDMHSMMKKTSQNDISMSINHSYLDNRGTETERSYLYYKILQKKNYAQNKSLKKLIDKKNNDNDLFSDYLKLMKKKSNERSSNIQKYLNLKFLRNSSGVWSSEKSDNMSQFKFESTQNHYSKSQSSFLMERENSKSENTTSRNNRVRVSSYIKTPTKNNNELIKQLSPRFVSQQFSSYQVSSSKINSLLSSMNKEIEKNYQPSLNELQIYHLGALPKLIQNDPNQTHIIVCNSDLTIKIINLYSGRISLIGKHSRPIKSISRVIIQQNCKTFYTGSQDGEIQQWSSESMHGSYKLHSSWRMEESPIQLYQTEKGILYVLTANHLYYYSAVAKTQIRLRGNVKCLLQTPIHTLIAVNKQIYKVQKDSIVKLIELTQDITNMIYEDGIIYVLTINNTIILLQDNQKLIFIEELNIIAKQIYNMFGDQIIIQTQDNEFVIFKDQQIVRQCQTNSKISYIFALSQILLVGTYKKLIETIKC